MKNILCVIDLSGASEKVLEVAANISNACKGRLIILYPYRLIINGHQGNMVSLKANLENEAREKFDIVLAKLLTEKPHVCEFRPEIGFMADRINACVKRESVDMVIVGQQQAETSAGTKDPILQHLITLTQLPFVVVPTEMKPQPVYQKH